MLNDSMASTTLENPLPIDETSADFEIMLLVITGRTQEAVTRVSNWSQAQRLLDMSVKYQLDGHRHCFSLICRARASDDPWEAVFLACNQHPCDLDLLRDAILCMEEQTTDLLFKPAYFLTIATSHGRPCQSNFRTANIRIAFGLRLGVRGVLGYNTAARAMKFESTTATDAVLSYNQWAHEFVKGMKWVEVWIERVGTF
jgi:hypothetical protein